METSVVIATIASPIVALLVGAGQIGIIYWGLHQMDRAARSRSTQVDQICDGMRAQSKALEDMGAGLREQSAGLRELLKRTEPSM